MEKKRIGIVILATNAYFVLGIRFIKKFIHHYDGDCEIKFYFFSDVNPIDYLWAGTNIEYHEVKHDSWVDATNDKFKRIMELSDCNSDYLYYFDADTSVSKDFTEDWLIGDLVGGEHYGNRTWLANGAGFDRFEKSKAYVPLDSTLPYTYYYGAFFGGKKDLIINFCKTLREWQMEDKKIPYEPGVNDESYINAYFHFNPPMTVPCEDFAFDISHKGGIGETRDIGLDTSRLKELMLLYRNDVYDIVNNKIIILKKMEDFKQTWWDDNLDTRFEEFVSWVGGSESTSKVLFRKYVKERGYKSLIDVGCGNATEFFAYREEYPELLYTGIDSSSFLYEKNVSSGINMILSPGEKTGLCDNHSDVVFSRHVLEHQPNFKPIMSEMIRLSRKEAIHVFFIIPGDNIEHIGYDSSQNLYYNRYNKSEIEEFIYLNPKVKSHEWIPISDFECAITIQMEF